MERTLTLGGVVQGRIARLALTGLAPLCSRGCILPGTSFAGRRALPC